MNVPGLVDSPWEAFSLEEWMEGGSGVDLRGTGGRVRGGILVGI